MPKSSKHIEIVRTTVKGFSSMSQESAEAILVVLAKHYEEPRITIINDRFDLKALVDRTPDLVFVGMEHIPSRPGLGLDDPRRIWIAQYLDEHGIAYTGSTQHAHIMGRNKALAKQRVRDAGLATARFTVLKQGESFVARDIALPFPLFIKPTDRGGGQGIDNNSIVHTIEQLRMKVNTITNTLHADSLVETYLAGREFSVAILRKEHSTAYDILPIELIAPPGKYGDRILSRKVKSSNVERAMSVVNAVIKSEVADLAFHVFRALGGRDYGRIDIRLDAAGTPHFLEVNFLPSLIEGYGSFPKACMLNIGLIYESVILRIVSLGLARIVDGTYVSEPMAGYHPVLQPADALPMRGLGIGYTALLR